MARTPHSLGAEKRKALIDEVVRKTPFEIKSHRDCQKLSDLIFLATKQNISASTIRRLFGFEKSPFHPSPFTVEILEKFITHQGHIEPKMSEMGSIILDIYDPLHFETIRSDDRSFHAVYRKAAIALRNNEQLFLEVMDALATMPIGRLFYYDLFPDYEILPKFQYKGYERYLQYSTTKNDKLFALTLLIWSADKRGDVVHFKKWMTLLMKVRFNYEEIHPFVLGRYFACRITNAATKSQLDKWCKEAIIIAKQLTPQCGVAFGDFPGFHYFVAEALQLRNGDSYLLTILDLADKKYHKVDEYDWKGYYEQLDLFRAYALFKLGREEESKLIFNRIDCSKFYFISKEYFLEKYAYIRKLIYDA